MKAFLLIERHCVSFWEKGPEIKDVICVVLAESADEVPKITGGEYSLIQFDGAPRPVIRLPQELFSPYSEKVVQYENGPIHLYIGEEDVDGTYLFIIETPLLPSIFQQLM